MEKQAALLPNYRRNGKTTLLPNYRRNKKNRQHSYRITVIIEKQTALLQNYRQNRKTDNTLTELPS
jgi:hypothetical protein